MDRFIFFILSTLVGVILLFFPIYLELDAHYDMNKRKFAFAVFGYKWLKLLGGYIATYPGGLAIHLSQKKAILIPYSQLNSERKRFSIVRTFRLRAFIFTTETGADYLLPVAATQMAVRTYFFIKGGKKEKIKNNLWLTDGDILRVSLNCELGFNLFILLKNLFKFLKEKIKILWQKNHKNSTI